MPPTAQLFRKKKFDPTKRTEWDYLLVEAVHTIENERCHCGLPVYICHSDDPRIRFRVEEDTCEAKAAVDRYEDSQRAGNKDYKAPPGTSLKPVPYTTDRSDFVSYRDRYYETEYDRREEVLDSLRTS